MTPIIIAFSAGVLTGLAVAALAGWLAWNRLRDRGYCMTHVETGG
jgi:hypothetical protein